MPVLTYLESLDRKALKRILTEPKNAILKQYMKLFSMDNIVLTIGCIIGAFVGMMFSFYLVLCFIQWISDVIENKAWRGLWD